MLLKHLQDRYLAGEWGEIVERVAAKLAAEDVELEAEFAEVLQKKRFLPAGNTLLAGVCELTPNCSVLGWVSDDNFDEILELSKKLWTQRTGVGYNLSGMHDPVSALRTLSRANDAIDLGHRPKRGNMAVLNSDHPRIREFITCKARDGDIYNFNISVAVPRAGDIDEDLLAYIASLAWRTGDPGLVFLDNGEQYGPNRADDLQPVVTCVPCGEQFMHAYETCNLGSVNLNADDCCLDANVLEHTVRVAVQMLDRVIDQLVFPDERLEKVSLAARRIGLGVTGWADALQRRGIAYNSKAALEWARDLSKFITQVAEDESKQLAEKYGACAYGGGEYRNISMTCIAPTGGITGLTENEGYAIEPFFKEATTVDYRAHIDMQLAWQSGIHNAVSKTVNLPRTASINKVFQVYKYAMKKGCKGITVYRDGCKQHQPVALVRCIGCEQ